MKSRVLRISKSRKHKFHPKDKGIAATMRMLAPGQSFLAPKGTARQSLYNAGHRLGVPIRIAVEGTRYRVFRKGEDNETLD